MSLGLATRARRLAAVLGLVVVLGCSSGSDDALPPRSTTTTVLRSTTSTTSPTTTGDPTDTRVLARGTCANPVRGGVPSSASASRALGDVDDDGRDDTFYVRSGIYHGFGVATAAGLVSEWEIGDASGVDPSVHGLLDVDGDGDVEVFARPGRTFTYVLGWFDCALREYRTDDGTPFIVGSSYAEGATAPIGLACASPERANRRLVAIYQDHWNTDHAGPATAHRVLLDDDGLARVAAATVPVPTADNLADCEPEVFAHPFGYYDP